MSNHADLNELTRIVASLDAASDRLLSHLPHPKLALSIPEAAEQVSYSVETIRLAMRHGDLRASYANSKPVIRVSELQRWLDSLPTDEPAPQPR